MRDTTKDNNTKILLCDDSKGWSPSKELFAFYRAKGMIVDTEYINTHRHCSVLLEAYKVLGSQIDSSNSAKFSIAEIDDEYYCIVSNGATTGIEYIKTLSEIKQSLIKIKRS